MKGMSVIGAFAMVVPAGATIIVNGPNINWGLTGIGAFVFAAGLTMVLYDALKGEGA